MPIPEHQKILAPLYELFVAFVQLRASISAAGPVRHMT